MVRLSCYQLKIIDEREGMKWNCSVLVKGNMTAIKCTTRRSKILNPFLSLFGAKGFFFGLEAVHGYRVNLEVRMATPL